ncbi:Ku protein [bacterium]|nr:Ku protein [bacterium]MCI0603899.1 Ku protein [bacterium]
MAATIWNGRITFGLVSVPVKLFRAVESHDFHFNLLHESCRNRIRLQYYCPHHGRVVERSELVKGFEYEKGKYVLIEAEELERIEPDSSTNLDIEQFIDLSEVDPIHFEKTYYVGPAEEGTEKTFALLATAMEKKGRAGIGKLFMRDREYLALLRPALGGLVLQLLHYEDEIRKNVHKVDKGKVRDKELELAELLIDNLTEEFHPERHKNESIERVEELIESKVKGRKLTVYRSKPKPVVTDLMKALEQSLKKTGGGKKPVARAGQGLPIPNYDKLSVQEVLGQLEELSPKDLQKIRTYEETHKKRKSLMTRLKQTA